jgi:uncharacterized protein (UPF0332 family)
MMDYSELVDEGLVTQGRFARGQVEDSLRIARRDVATARSVMEISPEWAFNIAYNAMHQAGRAFMFHAGFRSLGAGHHATVIRFLEIGLGPDFGDELALLDRMRRKRNRATYDAVGTVSCNEAQEAISVAEAFVIDIERRVTHP